MSATWEIRQGDALDRLCEMPDGSVHTCVTSPPYFGLRDYGTGAWVGGDEGCDHQGPPKASERSGLKNDGRPNPGRKDYELDATVPFREVCGRCGARRVDQQVGLESTPDEYVTRLVEVCREVRRVLRDDGTLWLNLGDSYNAYNGNRRTGSAYAGDRERLGEPAFPGGHGLAVKGLKPKDLLGVPWMVAFALRQDGWYLRADIVWAKPNPMPESVTDRPTKAHEYVFLLSKGPRYFYDADAIREGSDPEQVAHNLRCARRYEAHDVNAPTGAQGRGRRATGGIHERVAIDGGRSKRSVWTVATHPFPSAHFAVFPPKLIEPCVLAGSSPRACGECGAPWERVVDRGETINRRSNRGQDAAAQAQGFLRDGSSLAGDPDVRTVGWQPTCDHQDDTGSCVVLDPFAGAGTAGLVATRHGRSFVGIELNPEYVEVARDRITTAERLGYRSPQRGRQPARGQVPLFEQPDPETT